MDWPSVENRSDWYADYGSVLCGWAPAMPDSMGTTSACDLDVALHGWLELVRGGCSARGSITRSWV